MRKIFLAFVWLLTFVAPASAIDFIIKDATPSANNVIVTVSLENVTLTNCPDNYCYLQGTLRAVTSSKFFGETLNNSGTWIDYITSPDADFVKANLYQTPIQDNSWNGILNMRFKLDDPNYLGPGEYELTLNRYTGKSNTGSNAKSNTISIQLSEVIPIPSSSPTPTSTPTPTPSPSPSPTPSPIPSPTPKPSPSPKSNPSPSPDFSPPPTGTIAGITSEINFTGFGLSPSPSPTYHPKTPSLNQARVKTALYVGTGLILTSLAGYFGYRKYRQQHKDDTMSP